MKTGAVLRRPSTTSQGVFETAPGLPSRDDVLAPVDFVAAEFPDGAPTAEGFEELLALGTFTATGSATGTWTAEVVTFRP